MTSILETPETKPSTPGSGPGKALAVAGIGLAIVALALTTYLLVELRQARRQIAQLTEQNTTADQRAKELDLALAALGGQTVAIADKAGVVWCSPEYFRLMSQLYLARWAEDPVEVVRIYLEKAWMLLGTPTLYPGPPFGIVLAIALVHLLAATAFGAWQRMNFMQGLVIEGVAVAFAGLFLAQAMAALPSHSYAMPVNAFVLVLFGVIVEFFARMVLLVRRAF